LRVASVGCLTSGNPVPLHALQVCSLIFDVMIDLSGQLRWRLLGRLTRVQKWPQRGLRTMTLFGIPKVGGGTPSQSYHIGTPALCNFAHFSGFEIARSDLSSGDRCPPEEAEMKPSTVLSALLINGLIAASTEQAGAVVYCQYIEHPAGCVARPGVVIAPTSDVRNIPPSIEALTRGSILRQDLFDRNNPNNLRSDWPGPRAQPAQH